MTSDYGTPDHKRRIAIKAFCRRCRGVAQPGQPWRQAVAHCANAICPLHPVRPAAGATDAPA